MGPRGKSNSSEYRFMFRLSGELMKTLNRVTNAPNLAQAKIGTLKLTIDVPRIRFMAKTHGILPWHLKMLSFRASCI